MLNPLRHAVDLAVGLATKDARDRENAQVVRELTARPLELPTGLTLSWLGTAGFRLDYQGQTLLIDPFLTRVPLSTVVRGRPALPDPALVDRFLPDPGTVVGVLAGHAHWDHAMDTPEIARRFDCAAYGSRSLAVVMGLHGLAERAVEVEPYRRYELGPFTVTFVPSQHSKLLFGVRVPSAGDTTCGSLDQLSPLAYGCGQTWGIHVAVAGIQLYHQGSADLIDDAVRHTDVDVFLAGVAGRSVTPDYWGRILPKLRPHTVVPAHYDDFLRPLDEPMGFTVNVALASLPEEIAAVSRDIRLAALPAPNPA